MDVAVETIHGAETDVDQVYLVALDAAVTAGLRARVDLLGGPRR